MLSNHHFWFGVVGGVLGVWAYHHFVSPLPAPKK